MQVCGKKNFVTISSSAACLAAILGVFLVMGTGVQAFSQGTAPAAASAIELQPYTAPDQSAQAGVPAGWTVSKGAETVIQMTGPQNETIFLGTTIVARNAPFQAGQKGSGGVDLSMPYTANLGQKLTMIFQQNAAVSGKPAPQINFTSATPIQLPPALGQCGRFVASITGGAGPMKVMGAICSLPLDSGGTYKNIMLLAQAPAANAAQDAPIASAVFQSYKIPPAMLARKLAPFTAPPPPPTAARPGGGGMTPSVIAGEVGGDVSSTCFDLGVIREVPNRQLPKECGGEAPNP